MAEVERIIIDAMAGETSLQLRAAHYAMQANIGIGEIIGVRFEGHYFGIKRNKASIRVYPQGQH